MNKLTGIFLFFILGISLCVLLFNTFQTVYINVKLDINQKFVYVQEIYTSKIYTHNDNEPTQCSILDHNRFDCFPADYGKASESECHNRGCCWESSSSSASSRLTHNNKTDRDINVPYCFFPSNVVFYKTNSSKSIPTRLGYKMFAESTDPSPWPNDVKNLCIEVFEEYEDRVHFKVSYLLLIVGY